MPIYFDHEKLRVYQAAIEFVVWADELLQVIERKAAVKDQLDRASTSIPLCIAEGNGKVSLKDRSRFLEIARGSAVECAACLDVIVAKGIAEEQRIVPGKELLQQIVRMITALINKFATQVSEDEAEYSVFEQDEEKLE